MLKSRFNYFILLIVISSYALVALASDRATTRLASGEEKGTIGQKQHDELNVELVGAKETDKDAIAVIAALQKLLSGIAHSDLALIGSCLSNDVTMFDDKSKKFLYGKESVIDHVKKNVVGTDSKHPIKRIVVYNPFVDVKGDTAMVSFRATKELTDKDSTTLESWCSEVFERKNGEWLVLQLKTNWNVAKSKSQQP